MKESINLLITGPLGHIGSRFIHAMNSNNRINKIVLIDNFSTLRYPSLFNLPANTHFKFIEGDILTFDFEEILKDIDVVLHLAAMTDAANSFEHEELVMKVNFEGTRRVAQACAKANVKMIFLSTTSVYGTQEEIVNEDCSLDQLNPQSPYAKTKLMAENFLVDLATRETGFKFTICRFGTIFGTSVGMRFHTAINKFIWQAVMDQPITVWKTALHQKRPYLSLSDAVRALFFIIEQNTFFNQIYNVVSLNISVNDIINEIKKYVPDTKIEFVESKIMNQLSYHVENKKFIDLGFTFTGALSEIEETVKLLKEANSSKNIQV
jgi:nucleoside-diphosphate-sugar epimerase